MTDLHLCITTLAVAQVAVVFLGMYFYHILNDTISQVDSTRAYDDFNNRKQFRQLATRINEVAQIPTLPRPKTTTCKCGRREAP